MLESKKYTYSELLEILSCNSRQALERKMDSYCIHYQREGERAPQIQYTITAIDDPFKVYCITELGFDSRTDFNKLRQYLYHYLCDNTFMAMTLKEKVVKMREYKTHISRQTISNYEQLLRSIDYFHTSNSDYRYCFVNGKKHIETDKITYNKSWNEFWDSTREGMTWEEAYINMKKKYRGSAKKIAIQEANAFYAEKINFLINLIVDSIESSLEK